MISSEVANCLRIDVVTVEVVAALRARGVRALLLKGPVTASWLYADRMEARPYVDIDLLVSPDDLRGAASVLAARGFHSLPIEESVVEPAHATCWFRDRDGVAVDLHRTIHGAESVPGEVLWRAASANCELVEVMEQRLEAPSVAFRLLHLVMHLRPRDRPGSRSWEDLERAVSSVSEPQWRNAAALALELGVADRMGPLLGFVGPGGRALRDRLGLPTRWPRHLLEEYRYPLEEVVLGRRPGHLGRAERVVVLGHLAFPPASSMAKRSPLASKGVIGLCGAYIARWFRVSIQLAGVVGPCRRSRPLRTGKGPT